MHTEFKLGHELVLSHSFQHVFAEHLANYQSGQQELSGQLRAHENRGTSERYHGKHINSSFICRAVASSCEVVRPGRGHDELHPHMISMNPIFKSQVKPYLSRHGATPTIAWRQGSARAYCAA